MADLIRSPRWGRRHAVGIACLACLWLAPPASAAGVLAEQPPPAGTIEFGRDLAYALDAARQTSRCIVVVFGAVWCPYCQHFQEQMISSPEVSSLAQEFLWVYVDIDLEVSLARRYEVTSTPHTLVLRADGTELASASGAPDGAAYREFLVSVRTAAEGNSPADLHDGGATTLTWTPGGFRGLSVCFSHVGYGPLTCRPRHPGRCCGSGCVRARRRRSRRDSSS